MLQHEKAKRVSSLLLIMPWPNQQHGEEEKILDSIEFDTRSRRGWRDRHDVSQWVSCKNEKSMPLLEEDEEKWRRMEWQREAINQSESFVPHKTDGKKEQKQKKLCLSIFHNEFFLFLVFEAQKDEKVEDSLKLKLRGSSTTQDSPAHSTFLLHVSQCPADWRYFQLFFIIFRLFLTQI